MHLLMLVWTQLQIKVDEVTTRTVDLNQYKDSRSSLYHVESC